MFISFLQNFLLVIYDSIKHSQGFPAKLCIFLKGCYNGTSLLKIKGDETFEIYTFTNETVDEG